MEAVGPFDRLAGHRHIKRMLGPSVIHLCVEFPNGLLRPLLTSGCRVLTESLANIKQSRNIIFLCVAVALIPFFIFRMSRQEKLGNPTLIPNSLWRNVAFTSICLTVLLSWATCQSMELFFSLLFVSLAVNPDLSA